MKLFVLGLLVVALGHMGLSQQRATALFAEKLSQAKRLLADLPSGWNFAVGLESYGTYIEAVKIQPQSASFLRGHNHADGGGISKNENGQYEIFVNPDVSVERLAHTLAHELQHIRDEMAADEILKQDPLLQQRIQEATRWIHQGESRRAITERKIETNFVMQSLFCTEYRAHSLNLILKKEGLSDFFLKDSEQLLSHVENGYIRRHGFRLLPQDVAQLTESCAYQRGLGEANPLQTLLKSNFPAMGGAEQDPI